MSFRAPALVCGNKSSNCQAVRIRCVSESVPVFFLLFHSGSESINDDSESWYRKQNTAGMNYYWASAGPSSLPGKRAPCLQANTADRKLKDETAWVKGALVLPLTVDPSPAGRLLGPLSGAFGQHGRHHRGAAVAIRTENLLMWGSEPAAPTLAPLWWCLATRSCPALCDPVGCSPPGSLAHGISQARTLGWVAISSSMGSSWPRESNSRQILYHGATQEATFTP